MIFERLAQHYGAARMASHWSGLDAVKTKGYWARKLAYMPRRNIGYALRHLPEIPPTVDDFLKSCRRCPPPPVSCLLDHKPTKEEWERTRAKAKEVCGNYLRRARGEA